jgi:hypothetical protein
MATLTSLQPSLRLAPVGTPNRRTEMRIARVGHLIGCYASTVHVVARRASSLNPARTIQSPNRGPQGRFKAWAWTTEAQSSSSSMPSQLSRIFTRFAVISLVPSLGIYDPADPQTVTSFSFLLFSSLVSLQSLSLPVSSDACVRVLFVSFIHSFYTEFRELFRSLTLLKLPS